MPTKVLRTLEIELPLLQIFCMLLYWRILEANILALLKAKLYYYAKASLQGVSELDWANSNNTGKFNPKLGTKKLM